MRSRQKTDQRTKDEKIGERDKGFKLFVEDKWRLENVFEDWERSDEDLFYRN
jgi:hypothetical protein